MPILPGLPAKYRNYLWLSLVLYLVAAICSSGFYHYDEHFQILEFLNYKLGGTPVTDMPWEFGEKIRPFLQPFILYCIAKPLSLLGLDNPFVLATLFRLITGVLSFLTVLYLIEAGKSWMGERAFKVTVVTASLLWFFPFLGVRPSSETWSGIFFFLGLALLSRSFKPALFVFVGFLWGCAFQFRYQMGICVFFGGLNIFFHNRKLSSVFFIGLGICFALGIASFADWWGYGGFVFTEWNYFRVNLLEGKASQWGVSPFWDYFRLVFLRGIPPLSLLLMLCPIVVFIKKPTHILTWTVLPFILIHMLIPHKEIRFLFPVYLSLPLFIGMSLDYLKIPNKILLCLLVLNCLILFPVTITPARTEMSFYHFVFRKKIRTLGWTEENPYVLANIPLHFYRPKDLELKETDNEEWVFFPRPPLNSACKLEYSKYSDWLYSNSRVKKMLGLKNWSVLHCQGNPNSEG